MSAHELRNVAPDPGRLRSRLAAVAAVAILVSACSNTKPVVVEPEIEVSAEPVPPPPPRYGAIPGSDLDTLFTEPYDGTRSIDVYYATNRVRTTGAACSDDAYGVEPSDSLYFGVCRMNVPGGHPIGSLNLAPSPRSDPDTYYRTLGHEPVSGARFTTRLAGGPRDALVFVHGFNVKFGEAVLRAAQIAYDLKFQGPVVLFSWPAGTPPGFLSGARVERTYEHNRRNAAASIGQAVLLLRRLETLDLSVHVIVHSMGHQVVLPAIAAVSDPARGPILGELVLNAPDFPVADFQDMAPRLVNAARRVTVYCSYNDRAIAASEMVNDGRRMGACERADGVDVINVGELDDPGLGGLGHGYYASRPILTDIFQVLLGLDARNRLFVRKAETNGTQDWYLRR